MSRCVPRFPSWRYLFARQVADRERKVPKVHLSKSAVDKITCGDKETVFWDSSLTGFGLKVTPKGRKVFIVLYRTRDGRGKLRKFTIGPFGQITLAAARRSAQKVLAVTLDGR